MTRKEELIKAKEIAEAQKTIIQNQYDIQMAPVEKRIIKLTEEIEKTPT